MDPLSATASIIALLQLLNSLVGGLKVISSLHDAPKDASVLVDELLALELLLRQVSQVFDQPAAADSTTILLLRAHVLRTGQMLSALEAFLRQKIFDSDGGKAGRFAWLRHSDRIKCLRENLRECKLNLSLLTTSASLSGIWAVIARLDGVEKSTLPQILLQQQAQAGLLRQVYEQQLLLAPSQPPAPGRNTEPVNVRQLSLTWNSPVSQPLPLGQSSKRRQRCSIACSCTCHKPVKLNSASTLSPLIGAMYLKYRELPALAARCDERSCKRQMAGYASFTYILPPWLLNRMISITYSPTQGLHLVLRAPRIVSDEALILRYAAAGNVDGIKQLMTEGLASPGDVGVSYGMTALHVAFVNKDVELCRFLIQHGADPTYETTLRRSVLDIVRDENINGKIKPQKRSELAVIFDDIDDCESFQLSPLHKSILGISPLDLLSQLQTSTAYIDTSDSLGRTALSAAAWRGDVSAVNILLSHRASANICTPTELSPLHRAIESRSYECVKLLIEHGADVNHQNKRGRSPLHYACRIPDDGAIAKLLLENGANVDAEDHGRRRPIHEATIYGQQSQLTLVVRYSTDIDAASGDGKTALHLAIYHNNVAAVEELLHSGADVTKRTKEGATCVHLTARFADARTMRVLSSFGVFCHDNTQLATDGSSLSELLGINAHDSKELRKEFYKLLKNMDITDESIHSDCDTDEDDTFEDALTHH